MRHLMSPLDFTTEELDKLFDLAASIESDMPKYAHACEGKILATCFYEPSTRTRLSFESAMTRLGGQVLGFSDAASSSAARIALIRQDMKMAARIVATTIIMSTSFILNLVLRYRGTVTNQKR